MPSYTYEKTFYEYESEPFLIGKDMNCDDIITFYRINPENPKYEYHVVFEDTKTKEKTIKAYSWYSFIHCILHYFIPMKYKAKNGWEPCLPLPVRIYDCGHPNYIGDQISIYDLYEIVMLTNPNNIHDQNVLTQYRYYLICKPCLLPVLRYTTTIPSNPIRFKTHCSQYNNHHKDNIIICGTAMIGETQLLADVNTHQKEMTAKGFTSNEKAKKEGYECQLL